MKTAAQIVEEMQASDSEYVTYGASELGTPVRREDAIADLANFAGMEDELIGDGLWYECDEKGNVEDGASDHRIYPYSDHQMCP
jgi:hypothetical protein